MQVRRAYCDAVKSTAAALRCLRKPGGNASFPLGRRLHALPRRSVEVHAAASSGVGRRYTSTSSRKDVIADYKRSLGAPKKTHSFSEIVAELEAEEDEPDDTPAVLHGYIGTRRNASKSMTFAELHDPQDDLEPIQLVVKEGDDRSLLDKIRSMPEHSPIAVTGMPKARLSKSGDDSVELAVSGIHVLNEFPSDIIMTPETNFGPDQRHLQLRNSKDIRSALYARHRIASKVREVLSLMHEFVEIETPILFKSTPEGAREFLVPTRSAGHAYALPQSPQQYKQILMASGINRYMQIAKCFRDEDLRADRQPEFTQIDLEMSFANDEDVMGVVESLVQELWTQELGEALTMTFPRMTYEHAMERYGSDKPDLRLGSEIRNIGFMLPVDLLSKIGPLNDPIVEVIKIPISDDANVTRRFVSSFMDSPASATFIANPSGQPGIFIYDIRKPLQGLQPFGFEAAEAVEEMLDLQEGDLLVLQARPNAPFSGEGSTPLGRLRLGLHKAAQQQSLLPKPTGYEFTWVTDFPLFTPTVSDEPGQGGSAGLSSTHHPFTSPASPADVDLLLTDPLKAKAAHYDLVCNGVELGGGSRRIHSAAMQELIMRDVLKMSDERVQDFAHLLEVLRAGCPPHAGLALGFDRLVAVMLGKESVRDVIAFPKSGRGEDGLVGSPSKMTEGQLKTYHLELRVGRKEE